MGRHNDSAKSDPGSWLDKFYPEAASADFSLEEMKQHTLRKWTGLLPKNLKKYGLRLADKHAAIRVDTNEVLSIVIDAKGNEILSITTDTCCYCLKYHDKDCEGCPIMQALGKPCYSMKQPYHEFTRTGNPQPMIDLVKSLREEQVMKPTFNYVAYLQAVLNNDLHGYWERNHLPKTSCPSVTALSMLMPIALGVFSEKTLRLFFELYDRTRLFECRDKALAKIMSQPFTFLGYHAFLPDDDDSGKYVLDTLKFSYKKSETNKLSVYVPVQTDSTIVTLDSPFLFYLFPERP